MPSKIILRTNSMTPGGEIFLQQDGGDPVKLTRVIRANVLVSAEEPPMVELVMYAPDMEEEILVSNDTAEAINRHERSKELRFLDDRDTAGLIDLRHTLLSVLDWPADDDRLKPIAKIIAVLERREEILF